MDIKLVNKNIRVRFDENYLKQITMDYKVVYGGNKCLE